MQNLLNADEQVRRMFATAKMLSFCQSRDGQSKETVQAIQKILCDMEQLYRDDAFGFEDLMLDLAPIFDHWLGNGSDDGDETLSDISGDEEEDDDNWSEKASELCFSPHRNSPRDSGRE